MCICINNYKYHISVCTWWGFPWFSKPFFFYSGGTTERNVRNWAHGHPMESGKSFNAPAANIKGVYWWDPWSTIYSIHYMDPMGYRMYRSKMSWANDFNQSERHLTMNSSILNIYRTAVTDQSQFRCFFNRFLFFLMVPKVPKMWLVNVSQFILLKSELLLN